jgi:phospholipid/cholesterol/gamma-HCH transport system ATP-binding protein
VSGPPPVSVHGLVARYGRQVVLDGIDLEVQRGEVHVILGGSGCGKSTLLKHIVGLARPAAGEVQLLGLDMVRADEPEREQLLRRVGVLFQSGALLNSLTVHENVALPLRECTDLPAEVIDEVVRLKLALVGLEAAAGHTPRELSGGMKKRAGLARALALDPEVLFCDEPSAGLDPITGAALDRLLLGIRDRFGTTLVVVTHELASIEAIADQVTMLGRGKVLAQGTLGAVKELDDEEVRAFFRRQCHDDSAATRSLLTALGGR